MFRQVPVFQKPFIVGYMSVDKDREYHSDLSQLKYVTRLPQGKLSYDLNHNMDSAVKRTTDDNNEKIDLLLKFVLDQKSRLSEYECKFMFFTYRRTLISVLCNTVNPQPLRIAATLYNDKIYFCSLETAQALNRRKNTTEQEKKFIAWGYKFEQYLTSDSPFEQPDIQKPVVENEEFSLYYKSNFGDHTLLIGAQIDGMIAWDEVLPPPKTTDVENSLEYLKKSQFLELKTSKEIQHYKQERSFKKYKLLLCWCQCFLANLEGVLVGFRNDHGIIQRLQWYSTRDIVNYCRHEWCPEECLSFLNSFLKFVKNSFREYVKKEPNNTQPISLEFEIDERNSMKYAPCPNIILPDWYTNRS